MRSNSKEPVNVLWRSLVWLCAVFLLLTCPLGMAVEYDAGTAITDVSIRNLVADQVWLAGSPHTLTCTTSTDTDRCRADAQSQWQDIVDSVTHYWTGTGTFQGNHYIGTSVTYICSNTAVNNNVTVHANDDYAPDNNTFIVDDRDGENEMIKSDTKTVSVIIPVVDQITYGGGNAITDVTAPEYDRATSKNEPASYVMESTAPTAALTFWAATSLTEASDVHVRAYISGGDLLGWDGGDGSFGTTWPSAQFSTTNEVLRFKVGKVTYTAKWQYSCPTGSNTWIDATSQTHEVYVTLAASVVAPTKQIIDYACTWADSTTTDAAACDALLTNGFAAHYTWKGNCHELASDLVRLGGALGITISQHYWGIKAVPNAVDDMLTLKTRTIDPVGPPPSASRSWVFHQWAEAGGRQLDPSVAAAFNGSWGNYEDDLFTEYERILILSPFDSGWANNQAGQSAGCEAAAQRDYDANPTVEAWRGPER